MKAVIWTRFGPPETLKFVEVPKPVLKDNEILVKIFATSVHRGDVRIRAFDVPFSWWTKAMAWIFLRATLSLHPILGFELSGKVESVGKNVTDFRVGDEVMAEVSTLHFGGYAEYICLPADGPVFYKPRNLSYEESAVIPAGGITSLGTIKNAGIGRGHRVLIYGASGSLGTYCIQICKHVGAHVMGVCSKKNMQLVKKIGADAAIDYQVEDFSMRKEKYDYVIDAVGKMSKEQADRITRSGAIIIDAHKDSDKVKKKDFKQLLRELKDLCESGALRPVIDRVYDFKDIVDAHRYVGTGHKRGHVAVTVAKARK